MSAGLGKDAFVGVRGDTARTRALLKKRKRYKSYRYDGGKNKANMIPKGITFYGRGNKE